MSSVVEQVSKSSTPAWRNVEEYFELRLRTIGVRPGFVYSEWVYSLSLPEVILTNRYIIELENAAAMLIILHNDILSHFGEGSDHLYNTVAILRKLQGLSIQEACDLIEVKYLPETFARWESAVNRLPSWGEDLDQQVQLYIKGIKDHVICNANWRFVDLNLQYSTDHRLYSLTASAANATLGMMVLRSKKLVVSKSAST